MTREEFWILVREVPTVILERLNVLYTSMPATWPGFIPRSRCG